MMRAVTHIPQLALPAKAPLALSPRKTPRQPRSIATVSAIIEAAARIIETEGLESLSTNRVAERAGVSIGSLYQYFPGITAITAALILRERDRLGVVLQEALGQTSSLPLGKSVEVLVARAIAHQLARPTLSRKLDQLESTLAPCGGGPADEAPLVRAIAARFRTHGIGEPDLAARDCIALARGMIDSAERAAETDQTALASRVGRAVSGYLAGAVALD